MTIFGFYGEPYVDWSQYVVPPRVQGLAPGAFQANAFQFRTHPFLPQTYDAFQVDLTSPIDVVVIDERKRKKILDAVLAEEKRKRDRLRQDIEYAAYGPPLPEPPEFKIELPARQPDYSDLAKLIVSNKTDDDEEAIQLLLGAF